MKDERISVVIPCRPRDTPLQTVETLFQQTYQKLALITVIDWDNKGQSWARNEGIRMARSRYILFSDYDCLWEKDAVESLYMALRAAQVDVAGTDLILNRAAGTWPGFAYAGYAQTRNGTHELVFGLEPWNWKRLVSGNYISTMALVDTYALSPRGCRYFDEELRRLEDWDLWLRCGQANITGVNVPRILFTTEIKPGISHGGPVSHEEAEIMVRRKRGL